MNQQIFTIAEARVRCADRGFKKSRIWWNVMASRGKFNAVKMKLNGRESWVFSVDELDRIVAEKPMLRKKVLPLALAILLLGGGICFGDSGVASYYSTKDACGKKTNSAAGCPTASGRGLFDLERKGVLFCASNDYPIGTFLKVTNYENGKSTTCEVLDRGGFKKYGRKIDLGKRAFSQIAPTRQGTVRVKIQKVG